MAHKTHNFTDRQKMSRNTFEIFHYKDETRKEVPLHHHDFYELTVVLDGIGTYEYQGKTYLINAGDTFITLPGELHHYSDQQNLALMNFIWYPEQLPVSPEKLTSIPGYRTFFSLEPQSRSL